MVWALDLDDFTGAYEADGAKYPLIRFMRERWIGGSAPVPTPAPTAAPSTPAPATSVAPSTPSPSTSAPPTSAPSASPTPGPSTSGAAPAPGSECGGGCSQCAAVPGNSQAATDEACAPCASGQTWWPCNLDLCYCAGSSAGLPASTSESAPPTTPTTAAASTPAPSSTTAVPAAPAPGASTLRVLSAVAAWPPTACAGTRIGRGAAPTTSCGARRPRGSRRWQGRGSRGTRSCVAGREGGSPVLSCDGSDSRRPVS